MAPFKVIIVGGGLAGALLANGLMNNGVEVAIYERDAADSKREGYQIRLGEAAQAGFKACLTGDIRTTLLTKLGKSANAGDTAPAICNSRFETLLDLTKFGSYSKSSAINRVVLRDTLLEPVRAAGRVTFQKKLDRYRIISDGGNEHVQLHFSDGSTDTCDILVGADGSRSTINQQVGVRNLVDINSHLMFLNKGDLTQQIIKNLPARLQSGPVITFTKDLLFFFALYLPPPQGQSSQKNGGLEYDLDQGSFYWGLIVRRDRSPYDDPSKIPNLLEFCQNQVKDWAPEYHAMINAGLMTGQTNNIIAAPLRASKKPSKQWRDNIRRNKAANITEGHPRVWLIGDAIHAMQPNRGMGGNQAMQDCADILPELLGLSQIAKSGTTPSTQDVSLAVKRYENKMIDRAFLWVQRSGGTSVPEYDLDGRLGTVLKVFGSVVWLFTALFVQLFGSAKARAKQE